MSTSTLSPSLLNLNLPIVTQEVESVLQTYPSHPYQRAFAIPSLKEQLVAYVLNQIPSRYRPVGSLEEALERGVISWSEVRDQKQQVQPLIHLGIVDLYQRHMQWINTHIPEVVYSDTRPSTWFG